MAGKKIGKPDSNFSFINKLKNNKNLVQNFTSLSVLQISNYIFPLITLPYLVRVLGPGKFGLVSFAIAFNGYFLTICDYGFNLTGTRSVSVERNDKAKLNQTFSAIISIKLSLLFLSFLVLLILINTIDIFEANKFLFLICFGLVVGTVLFPVWFFMGLERMKEVTVIQVGVKAFFTAAIFIFIKNENDFLLYAGINSGAIILMGVIAVSVIIFKLKLQFRIPTLEMYTNRFKEGWNIYISAIANNIYSTSNIFILGLFAPDVVIGYYAAADKIRIAAHGVLSVISQSIFPHSSALFKKSVESGKRFMKKVLTLSISTGIILSILLFAFSGIIVTKFLGAQYENSIIILRILSISLVLNSVSYTFGILTFIPMGYDKLYYRIVVSSAIIHILLLFLIVPKFFATGTASVLVFTELLLMLQYIFFYKRKF